MFTNTLCISHQPAVPSNLNNLPSVIHAILFHFDMAIATHGETNNILRGAEKKASYKTRCSPFSQIRFSKALQTFFSLLCLTTHLGEVAVLIPGSSARRLKRFLDRKKGTLVPGAAWTVFRSKFYCSERRRARFTLSSIARSK